MKRSPAAYWLSRVKIVILAAGPTLACVSGMADPLDDASGGSGNPAGSLPSGSAGSQPSHSGSAGTSTHSAGASSSGGNGTTAGSSHGGASSNAGNTSSGGSAPVEVAGSAGSSSGGSASGGTGNTNNGDCVLDKLLPSGEASYHALFIPPWQGHQEKSLYSYSALCQALETHDFGAFASSGNSEADKREVAAFFAHVAKETAFLEQTDEAGQPSTAQDYHGRGAIQLTGQANYQAAGDYLGKGLVQNPGMVATDAVTNWQVALWFWVVHNNPGTAGTKNCHQAIVAGDFAQTTRIINGGIECPGSASAQTRADYYKNNCGLLSVSPGNNLVC